jgi:hypothetical protein
MNEKKCELKVLNINSEFYRAFKNLSIEKMETLWKQNKVMEPDTEGTRGKKKDDLQ